MFFWGSLTAAVRVAPGGVAFEAVAAFGLSAALPVGVPRAAVAPAAAVFAPLVVPAAAAAAPLALPDAPLAAGVGAGVSGV